MKDWSKVIALLENLSSYFRKQSDQYRAKAFERVLPRLKEVSSPEEARRIKGVGPGIMKRIQEAWDTGDLQELRPVPLSEIRMSPILREYLVTRKIKSIPALNKAIEEGRVQVPHRIKILAKYFGRLTNLNRRQDIEAFASSLVIPAGVDSLTLCGSFRRGKKYVRDIDILLIPKAPAQGFLGRFVRGQSYIVDHLTPHLDTLRTKYMGIARLQSGIYVRIDIRYVTKESKGAALLYFTGPAKLNEKMRRIAKDRGLHLNEYGLWKKDTRVASTEKQIFFALGLEYLKPSERI